MSRISREQSACFDWLTVTHVCQPFTPQIRVYQHEQVGEKVGENRGKSICRQQFANMFADCFCAVHTHQLEFPNTSLPTLVCRVKAAQDSLLIQRDCGLTSFKTRRVVCTDNCQAPRLCKFYCLLLVAMQSTLKFCSEEIP